MLASPEKSTIVRLIAEAEGDHVVETVFAGLSLGSRFLRFHSPVRTLSPGLRARLLPIDGQLRVAVAAWVDGEPVGIARLAPDGHGGADIGLAVVDAWQRRGIGRRLFRALTEVALGMGCSHLDGAVLPGNVAMLGLVHELHPYAFRHWDGDAISLTIPIGPGAWEVTEEQVVRELTSR